MWPTTIAVQKRERLIVEDDCLRFQSEGGTDWVVAAQQVEELWYDYNPCGWQHANSWRIEYVCSGDRKSVNVFEQTHLREPLLRWLTLNFPKSVSETFERQFGWPGGDNESELVWQRS
jgi:hypothetical protein